MNSKAFTAAALASAVTAAAFNAGRVNTVVITKPPVELTFLRYYQ